MPFINKKEAFKLLEDMIKKKCIGECRTIWLRNIGYALKTTTNPLKLTATEHKKMTSRLKDVKNNKTQKMDKYLTRNSPPFPANEYCGKSKKGNDGKMYKSVPDKNNICRWKIIHNRE